MYVGCSHGLHFIHRVRRSTHTRLKELLHAPHGPLSLALEEWLRTDPLYPILTQDHLEALDRRHRVILGTIQHCIDKHSEDNVLVDHWS